MASVRVGSLRLALHVLTEGDEALVPKRLASKAFERAAARLADRSRPWLAARGVQGIGIGSRTTQGTDVGELALKVYVDRKKARRRVTAPVPKRVSVPGLGAIETDVEPIGKIALEACHPRLRPARPGCSVGHPRVPAGTFGCLVRKPGQAGLFVLSNAHVLAAAGAGRPGDPILQPARDDCGRLTRDAIADLTTFVPFQFTRRTHPQLVDAAIARVRHHQSVSAALLLLGAPPSGVSRRVLRGMRVHKIGRTTDRTTGVVLDADFKMAQRYLRPHGRRAARVGFRDQVLCQRFTLPGDSGAVVLNDQNEVVGLHFAGTQSRSVFNKIGHVLDALGIEIVTDAG